MASLDQCFVSLIEQKLEKKLKVKQKEALQACRAGKDVLAILPTGYGKTVIIEALPHLGQPSDKTSKVVVVNPLNAIIQEQKARFGDKAVIVDDKIPEDAVGKFQDISYIIGHPETFMSSAVQKLLLSLGKQVSHIVVDEAHCINSWGKSSFRPAFMKLGLLRSLLPKANVVALTATSTHESSKEIINTLAMMDPEIISESPDRSNVYLEVKHRLPSTGGHQVEESYEQILKPIFRELNEAGPDFDRTIIYLPLKWCGHAHHLALRQYLSNMGEGRLQCMVQQYHAPQTQQVKSYITEDMGKPDGTVRLLLATEAYGMGADSPNVRSVIHIGPPKNLETYVQEIGRGGRDGLPYKATIYYNRSDISPSVNHLDSKMREYCVTSACRRNLMLEYFGHTNLLSDQSHMCCDNCSQTCTCEECQSKSQVYIDTTRKSLVNTQESLIAKNMLSTYFNAENALCSESACGPAMVTGLSNSLINILIKDVKSYSNVSQIHSDFPELKSVYVVNIAKILTTILEKKMKL